MKLCARVSDPDDRGPPEPLQKWQAHFDGLKFEKPEWSSSPERTAASREALRWAVNFDLCLTCSVPGLILMCSAQCHCPVPVPTCSHGPELLPYAEQQLPATFPLTRVG